VVLFATKQVELDRFVSALWDVFVSLQLVSACGVKADQGNTGDPFHDRTG